MQILKTKLIASDYMAGVGISYVKVQTRYGEYEGRAVCHIKDMEIESEFTGCQIAEIKAVIAAYKDYRKILKAQIDLLEHFLNSATKDFKFTRDHKRMVLRLEALKKERNFYKDIIKQLYLSIPSLIDLKRQSLINIEQRKERRMKQNG